MKKRLFFLLTLLLTLCLLFAACSKAGDDAAESPEASIDPKAPSVATPNPTPEATPEPAAYRHPLTGEPLEEKFGNARPYAFMINNIIYAQPQCGISRADIVYEVLAEGGITRMMAIFTDLSDVGNIGSMRSIRTYYVDIALSYDAIPIHAGGSTQAYTHMSELGIKNIDGCIGDYSAFYRDPSRASYGVEHSLFTTGESMLEYLDKQDVRREHEDEYDYGLRFTEDAVPDGGSAESVEVNFAGSKTTGFTYDAGTGLYAGAQYDGAWCDGNTGGAMTFRNLLVLYAATSVFDSYGRLEVVLTGTGSGYFVNGGKYTEINWSRDDLNSSFSYALSDGTPLELGIGTSYIGIVPTGSVINLT